MIVFDGFKIDANVILEFHPEKILNTSCTFNLHHQLLVDEIDEIKEKENHQ